MNLQQADCRLVFSAPVEIALKPKSFSRKHDGPREVICVKIDALVGGRVITTRDFTFDQSQVVLGSTIFDAPIRLALVEDKRMRLTRSVRRVSIAAVPTTPGQAAALLEIEGAVSGGLGIWELPAQQVGLFLGDRWVPVVADVLKQAPVGADLVAGSRVLGKDAARSSTGSLSANLTKALERLLSPQVQFH